MPHFHEGLPEPVANRDLRALRSTRRHNAVHANLAKINGMNRTIQDLRTELSQWMHFAQHPSWVDGDWLRVPRFAAMSDTLFAHWTACQVSASDCHSAYGASVASTINVRGNVAKHLGLYAIIDFGTMSDLSFGSYSEDLFVAASDRLLHLHM